MKILVDMDGVLADFDSYLKDRAHMLGYMDVIAGVDDPERRTLKVQKQGGPLRKKIMHIMTRPGFFYSLPPIKGGFEVINRLLADGHDVFICTSPVGARSIQEKTQWVQDYLGRKWVDRLILTGDKTIMDADFLIDDKPDINGANKCPSWKQIVFTHHYNQHLETPYRIDSWDDFLEKKFPEFVHMKFVEEKTRALAGASYFNHIVNKVGVAAGVSGLAIGVLMTRFFLGDR